MEDIDYGAKVLSKIASTRQVQPKHRVLASVDPAFLEGFNQCFVSAHNDESPLPKQYRELIFMVAGILTGSGHEGIAKHATRASEAGASRAEIVNAVEIAALVAASPAIEALVVVPE